MDDAYILSHVDHTLLSASATWSEIESICEEAIKYNTASVCIPPCYISRIRNAFPNLNICTVIGFPLGYDVTASKVIAAKTAIDDGAHELDMVVNISNVKNGLFAEVEAEITELRKIAGDHILKVIIETCYLTEPEKISLCKIVTDTGADFIKTSTGLGTAGATMEDVKLFKEHIGSRVRIKAAGGIRAREDMVAFLDAGCDRLGTSSAVKLLTGGKAGAY